MANKVGFRLPSEKKELTYEVLMKFDKSFQGLPLNEIRKVSEIFLGNYLSMSKL